MTEPDLVVIGAGPAGLSAAKTAADEGARVTLIDEQASPGGQIHRGVLHMPEHREYVLGPDYVAGRPLAEGVDNANIKRIVRATVWRVDDDGTVTYSVGGQAARVRGRSLIIATGALERPVPVPGWTLPGVMTAGAAQILLKASGVAVENAVLAGSGPLLYLVAWQLIRAGSPPVALVETQTPGNWVRALGHLGGALRGASYLAKGMTMLHAIKRARVPRYTGAKDIELHGDGRVRTITFKSGGPRYEIDADAVLLHGGVAPNCQISRSLRLDHEWDKRQRCFKPKTGAWGATANPLIRIAGDGGGIGGAKAAACQGELAALGLLAEMDLITPLRRDDLARPVKRNLAREMAVRPFLDALHSPPKWLRLPGDEVIVCRCEEVTAGDIRRYAALGCKGPNQAKAFGRPGMGPCQGRYCGLSVTEILADANSQSPAETGYYRIRAPLKPVNLGELAGLAEDDHKGDLS